VSQLFLGKDSLSTKTALYVDECRKTTGLSTKTALYVDECRKTTGLSTKTALYVDQYHELRLLQQKINGSLGIQRSSRLFFGGGKRKAVAAAWKWEWQTESSGRSLEVGVANGKQRPAA
jgi:hypothetical protein